MVARLSSALWPLAVGTLLIGCAGLRETLPPNREGSLSNLVRYGYFTVRHSPFSRVAFREFNVDSDEQVTFVSAMALLDRAYVLRGDLRRPDGALHDRFVREVRAYVRGAYGEYDTSQVYPMKDLKPFPGEWTLELFVDDDQVGAFSFFLGDAKAIGRHRAP